MSDSEPSYEISVYNELNDYPIPHDTVCEFTSLVLSRLKFKHAEVSISFVDQEEIQRVNLQHRKKDCPTDVLSFPMLIWNEPVVYTSLAENDLDQLLGKDAFVHPGQLSLGDIVICTEVAASNAQKIGHSLGREVAFLIIHSIFHLLGHDHQSPGEEHMMLKEQRNAMQNITEHPYILKQMEAAFSKPPQSGGD